MTNNTPPLDEILTEFFFNTAESPQERDQDLAAFGVDLGAIQEKVRTLIGKKEAQLKLAAARQKRERLLDAPQRATSFLHERIQSLLKSLEPIHPEQALVFHRRFAEATPEDLETLEEDLQDILDLEHDNEEG